MNEQDFKIIILRSLYSYDMFENASLIPHFCLIVNSFSKQIATRTALKWTPLTLPLELASSVFILEAGMAIRVWGQNSTDVQLVSCFFNWSTYGR